MFLKRYKEIQQGDENWKSFVSIKEATYNWNLSSTYVKQPPFFSNDSFQNNEDIINSRVLVMLGDSITTDHISPAGSIKDDSPAGKYLSNMQIPYSGYNSYGARRGNHEVMIRGTFANVSLKNELVE